MFAGMPGMGLSSRRIPPTQSNMFRDVRSIGCLIVSYLTLRDVGFDCRYTVVAVAGSLHDGRLRRTFACHCSCSD